MGEIINAYTSFIRKPEGKRPLERYRCRWEDNTKKDHKEMGMEGMDWIHLADDRVQWQALMNTNELPSSIKSKNFLE
jgi:hypothetical protein